MLAYSFQLAVAGVHVTPLRSRDRSDVPASVGETYRQSERWFRGPSSVLSYRRGCAPGIRRELITGSALAICGEWLSCAFALPALAVTLLRGDRVARRAAKAFLTLYAAQLLSTEALFAPPRPLPRRLAAIGLWPVANTLFGLAAWSSLLGQLCGREAPEKTERSEPPNA